MLLRVLWGVSEAVSSALSFYLIGEVHTLCTQNFNLLVLVRTTAMHLTNAPRSLHSIKNMNDAVPLPPPLTCSAGRQLFAYYGTRL